MKKSLNIKINPKILIIYIILYLLIIQSGSVQLSIINDNNQSKLYALLLMSLLIPFALKEVIAFKKEYINIIIVQSLFLLINLIKYPSSITSLLMKFLWFLGFFGFTVYCKKRGIAIIKCFSLMIFLLSCISLLLWFFVCFVDNTIIQFTSYDIAETVYYNWHNLFSYTPFYYTNVMGLNIYRLHGLFWEPGVYQIYLNLAIYHYLFEEKLHSNSFKLVILYLNLLFTMSTTGLCIGVFLLTLYLIELKSFKRIKKIAIIIGGFFVLMIFTYLLGKKMAASIQYGWHGSMAARLDDQIVATKLFFKNFLFGAGYDNGQVFLEAQGWGRGCTSGLMSWAYMMGIFGMISVVYPFIKNIKSSDNKDLKRKRVILFMIFLICNLSEPLYWAPLNWFWVASEYVKLYYERRGLNEPKRKKNTLYSSEIF